MSALSLLPTRRELLVGTAAAGAMALVPGDLQASVADQSFKPFTVNIPQREITGLRRRIGATRWPDEETVSDQSQGIKLTRLKPLAVVPPEIAAILAAGGQAPEGLSEKERETFDTLSSAAKMGNRSYAVMMGTRPQTVGYGLTDSPVGLAAWMLGHPGFLHWTYDNGDPEKSPDEVLDDITLYWLTKSGTSSGRLYWEYGGGRSPALAAGEKTAEIALPVAITVFPRENYRAPETWAKRAYRNLIYFHEVEKGGHFAAWEQPEIFAAEIRAAFGPLRASQRTEDGAAQSQESGG